MSDQMAKVTVEWEGKRVQIEGPVDFVAAESGRFRDAALGHDVHALPAAKANRSGEETTRWPSEAALIEAKQPQGHPEKIAVLAAHLQESGVAEFDSDEMRRAYLRAGIKPPKVMPQALIDAKRYRDFIEPTATKGKYKLTHFGSDFVHFDLPKAKAGK